MCRSDTGKTGIPAIRWQLVIVVSLILLAVPVHAAVSISWDDSTSSYTIGNNNKNIATVQKVSTRSDITTFEEVFNVSSDSGFSWKFKEKFFIKRVAGKKSVSDVSLFVLEDEYFAKPYCDAYADIFEPPLPGDPGPGEVVKVCSNWTTRAVPESVWKDVDSVSVGKNETKTYKLVVRKEAEIGYFSHHIVPSYSGIDMDEMSWWNYSFGHAKKHNITAYKWDEIDYQIDIIIHNKTGSDSGKDVYLGSDVEQADFEDIRFIAPDGTTELSYWIDKWDKTGSSVRVWVEMPKISSSGVDNFFYLYYGNSTAESRSDADETFLVYDDFNGVSLDTVKWPTNTFTVTVVQNSNITLWGYASGNTLTYKDTYMNMNLSMDYNASINMTLLGGQYIGPAFRSGTTAYGGDQATDYIADCGQGSLVGNDGGWEWGINTNIPNQCNRWFKRQVTINRSLVVSYNLTNNWSNSMDFIISPIVAGDILVTHVPVDTPLYTLVWGYGGYNKSISIDEIRVRNFSYPGPVDGDWVDMGEAPPGAEFHCSPTAIAISSDLVCTTDMTWGDPTSFAWYVENYTPPVTHMTSTARNPIFNISFPGYYNVNLLVTNAIGSSWENKTMYVTAYIGPMDIWEYATATAITAKPGAPRMTGGHQMMFQLVNTSGVNSGNTIYTNGSTKNNWYDINFTDAMGIPYPYWIQTKNGTTAIVWVRIPTIYYSGTVVKFYYGNASIVTDYSRGNQTFPIFVDRDNPGTWDAPAPTVVGGNLSFSITGLGASVYSTAIPIVNHTTEWMFGADWSAGGVEASSPSFAETDSTTGFGSNRNYFVYNAAGKPYTWISYDGGSASATAFAAGQDWTIYIASESRSGRGGTNEFEHRLYSSDRVINGSWIHGDTGYGSSVANPYPLIGSSSTSYYDYMNLSSMIVVNYTYPPPTFGSWTIWGPTSVDFSCTPQSGMVGFDISCTDTSSGIGTITSYAWYVENYTAPVVKITSTVKNPIFNISFPGVYNINHSVTNASGTGWYNRSAYINANGWWTLINSTPEYSRRGYSEVLKHNNLTYLFGGLNYDGAARPQKNIYNTSGANDSVWRATNISAGFGIGNGNYAGASASFNGRMYYYGGFDATSGAFLNATWYSDDGQIWVRVPNASWNPRVFPAALVYNDSVYIIGGLARASWTGGVPTYVNDTWVSRDGINFTRMNRTANWVGRSSHSSWIWNNRMYIAGGVSPEYMNDTWYSTDGDVWIGVGQWSVNVMGYDGFLGSGKFGTPVVPFDNKIWMIGGYNASGGGECLNSTHSSTDGVTWVLNQAVAEFPARSDYRIIIDNYRMQMFDGCGNGLCTLVFNDSWQSWPATSSPISDFTMTNQTASGCVGLCTVGFYDTSTSNTVREWSWKYTPVGGGPVEFSTDRNPTYKFPLGNYSISLTTSNEYGSNVSVRDAWVNISISASGWTASPRYADVPQLVTFTAGSSSPYVTIWTWDVNGDGVVEGNTHSYGYTYTSAGAYTINHSVSDGSTVSWENRSFYVIIKNPVTSSFSANTTTPSACSPVQFTSLSTGSNITNYSWVFGDGDASILQNVVHTYTLPGTYTVTHNVTDSNGTLWNVSATSSDVITASWLSPTVDFVASITTGDAPLIVQFTDNTTGASACDSLVSWNWDFGDGATDTVQNPLHTYTGGIWNVTLTVATNHGNIGTVTKTEFINAISGMTGHIGPGGAYPNTSYAFRSAVVSYDPANGTYLKYFMANLTGDRFELNLNGLAYALMLPMISIFGYWIFLIIWLTYLAAVWIRSQDLILPLVVGLITAGVWGVLIPSEAYLYVGVMFAICIGVILVKLVWSQY